MFGTFLDKLIEFSLDSPVSGTFLDKLFELSFDSPVFGIFQEKLIESSVRYFSGQVNRNCPPNNPVYGTYHDKK